MCVADWMPVVYVQGRKQHNWGYTAERARSVWGRMTVGDAGKDGRGGAMLWLLARVLEVQVGHCQRGRQVWAAGTAVFSTAQHSEVQLCVCIYLL